ncbi:MAG TPA: DNA-3-methyladenine glycosylase [Euzebyales bacterium]|nr:DNA-3-methyladenine glycosylase [Euzebyales bacterium]
MSATDDVVGVRLDRAFFGRDATVVAPALVGMLLGRPGDDLWGRVVEVEAYRQDDPACHAYRRRTDRNDPLWGPPGHAYVYRSYGVHWCFNVSTGADGVAQGCLIRAARPVRGLELMRARRAGAPDRELLRGPAKLCEAFDLTGAHSGRDVCADGPIVFHDDGERPEIAAGPRVGVSVAADVPWRFHLAGSRWVSAYRRSPRAPRP